MKTKKLIMICLSLVVAFTMSATGAFANTDKSSDGYNVGDLVRNFELENVDGKMISLKSDKNAKGYIVVFTCNTCPYAKMYEDRIIALHKKFASKGYPVIAINPNDAVKQPGDSFANMKKRSKEKKYGFPYLIDPNQQIAKQFGATRTPHIYVLNKEPQGMKVAYIGAIDDNYQDADAVEKKYVEKAIYQLGKGQSVSENFTKAIGCTIKWSES